MKTYGGVEVWLHSLLTSALDGCGQLHVPAALPLGKQTPVGIGWEAGWAPEPVWARWRREEEIPAPAGNRTSVV
jgi:hypothetical protein